MAPAATRLRSAVTRTTAFRRFLPTGTAGATGRRRRSAHRLDEVRSRHPKLWQALVADTRITCAYRGERFHFRSSADALCQCLRLMAVSDAFLAQAAYRLKARLQALGVPGLPRLAHRAAMVIGQVAIGDLVVVAPGLYLLHGQVAIDGFTEIGPGTLIAPFVTIGSCHGSVGGAIIGSGVSVGTGAVLRNVRVGDGARIGANAVIIEDVPAGATATGVPATMRPRPSVPLVTEA